MRPIFKEMAIGPHASNLPQHDVGIFSGSYVALGKGVGCVYLVVFEACLMVVVRRWGCRAGAWNLGCEFFGAVVDRVWSFSFLRPQVYTPASSQG